MEIKVRTNQSLFDIALQTGGTIETVMELARLNNMSITEEIEAGTVIKTVAPVDKATYEYYFKNRFFPATGITVSTGETINEGIEFWAVEYDFVVS